MAKPTTWNSRPANTARSRAGPPAPAIRSPAGSLPHARLSTPGQQQFAEGRMVELRLADDVDLLRRAEDRQVHHDVDGVG